MAERKTKAEKVEAESPAKAVATLWSEEEIVWLAGVLYSEGASGIASALRVINAEIPPKVAEAIREKFGLS